MRTRSQLALQAIAIFCCSAVLLAATTHLLHVHHPAPANRKHGKLELSVACSLCFLSMKVTARSQGLPALPAILVMGRLHDKAEDFSSCPVLVQRAGRAPPSPA